MIEISPGVFVNPQHVTHLCPPPSRRGYHSVPDGYECAVYVIGQTEPLFAEGSTKKMAKRIGGVL